MNNKKTVTQNNVTFNRGGRNEWIVVHNGTTLIYFDKSKGVTESKHSMFSSKNKKDCESYINENNIIIIEDI